MILNRIVTAYLEIAEIQASNRKPMYMADWIARLDDFLNMTGKEILAHAGKISHEMALEKAHTEYEKFQSNSKNNLSPAENDFIKHLETTSNELKKGRKN